MAPQFPSMAVSDKPGRGTGGFWMNYSQGLSVVMGRRIWWKPGQLTPGRGPQVAN